MSPAEKAILLVAYRKLGPQVFKMPACVELESEMFSKLSSDKTRVQSQGWFKNNKSKLGTMAAE